MVAAFAAERNMTLLAGRLLSIWRRSGEVNLADFPVLADLPIWRQLDANLAGPIWRESGRSGGNRWGWKLRGATVLASCPIWRDAQSGEMPNLARCPIW